MNVDEESQETPLLTENASKKQATALPWSQLIIVMILELAEPLTSYAISPFTPEVYAPLFYLGCCLMNLSKLIRHIGITHGNESKVGYYVGIMVR